MPVILAEGDWAKWLGEEPATNDELKALLVPFKDDVLTMWPVNRQRIGNVRNKDREVATPENLRRRKRHGHAMTAPWKQLAGFSNADPGRSGKGVGSRLITIIVVRVWIDILSSLEQPFMRESG